MKSDKEIHPDELIFLGLIKGKIRHGRYGTRTEKNNNNK
jgi:hypothetical protein